MSLEVTRTTSPNTSTAHAVPRVREAVPAPDPAHRSDTAPGDHRRQPDGGAAGQGVPPGPGYVLMQRFLVAADNLQGAHVKFPPNPVQLSLGLLTGTHTGAIMPDMDGDGISIEPPIRLDRRV